MDKALIEEPTVELLELFDEISTEAAREKLAVPPTNKMIYYWTRKPLVVGRAVALASTLKSIDDVRTLLGINRDRRAYMRIPNTTTYAKKLGRPPSEIKVLDPFGGGGNLIFEAKRLGLDCTCSDYNPLAHLIEKSVLEFPVLHGKSLAEDFERYATDVIEMTHDEIGKFYKRNDLMYFWTRCITCPHCGQRVPLTNSMWLANTESRKIAMRFHVTEDKNYTTEIITNATPEDGQKYTQKGGKAVCIRCKNGIDHETMRNDIVSNRDYELNAIKMQEGDRRTYSAATESDRKLFRDASEFFLSKRKEYERMNLIPTEESRPSYRDRLGHYGIKRWSDYFSSRQLLILTTVVKNIRVVCDDIKDRQYAGAMSVYLGFLLAKHVNFNSNGTLNAPTGEKIGQTLTMRMPMPLHNYIELNPFAKASGTIPNMIKNITDAIDFAVKNSAVCTVNMNSVTRLDQKFDLIITDPPYGDDVQYGELSDFLYVWIYRCLSEYYVGLPPIASLDEDFCVSIHRFENKDLALDFFKRGFKQSFRSISGALKDDGLLVVFFAHSGIDAWNTLLNSIRAAKLRIVSNYAVHTENTSNPVARDKTSFLSSIVVVCRKITEERAAYFEDIMPETEDSIKNMIRSIPLEKFITLPITDLLIMVYGIVLEACTQFTDLKSYSKNTEARLESVIKNSQEYILKEIITKLTGRSITLVDPRLAFFLLARVFYGGRIAPDDAIQISKVIALDRDTLEKDGIVTNLGGVTRLIPLHKTEHDVNPEDLDRSDTYRQLCHLCKICHRSGVGQISNLFSQGSGNLNLDEIKKTVSLLVKSGRMQRGKGRTMPEDEKEELKILETISDIWGEATVKGTIDNFV